MTDHIYLKEKVWLLNGYSRAMEIEKSRNTVI